METAPAAVYEPRNPRASSLYALVEDYYEEFERVYDERYPQQYGRWRPVIGEVMRKYLECGDLHRGFARLGCDGCRYRAILAYSCKCRLFCPSCQQKRVLLFAEWLDTHINQRGLRTGAGKPFTMTSLHWVQYARSAKSHKKHLQAAGLLTTKEMASKLQKSEKVVRTWRRKGILQACRCSDGHEWLYYPPDGEMNMEKTTGKIIDQASSPEACDANTARGVV